MMRSLKKLLSKIPYKLLSNLDIDINISLVCYDSRKANKGDLFICLKGAQFDSHTKIDELVKSGVTAIVVESNNSNISNDIGSLYPNTIFIEVNDTRRALASISKEYFDNPSDKLCMIGITGTKGKTTTAFMIKNILEKNGFKTGMIGTVGIIYEDKLIETDNTTPESYVINEILCDMIEKGITHVIMEVSSQSLKYGRVYGLKFNYVIFTNIAPEHIGTNEHTDFNDYFNSKLIIFENADYAVINKDTDYLNDIISKCEENNLKYILSGCENYDLKAKGSYNQKNARLAYAFSKAIDIDLTKSKKAIEETIVPGRCEVVYKDDDYTVVVDFAHEPNGAKNFLSTMKLENFKRMVVIFGCGGNRSKDRRYGMGEVAGKLSDFVILTADNSRYEKTIDIIKDIETTLSKYKKKDDLDKGYVIIEDRKEAIKYAINNHKKGDLICVIGKGHESTMETNGVKTRFLDSEEILRIINE